MHVVMLQCQSRQALTRLIVICLSNVFTVSDKTGSSDPAEVQSGRPPTTTTRRPTAS